MKGRKDTRVNQLSVRKENREKTVILPVSIAKEKGPIAKHCRKHKKRFERQGLTV